MDSLTRKSSDERSVLVLLSFLGLGVLVVSQCGAIAADEFWSRSLAFLAWFWLGFSEIYRFRPQPRWWRFPLWLLVGMLAFYAGARVAGTALVGVAVAVRLIVLWLSLNRQREPREP